MINLYLTRDVFDEHFTLGELTNDGVHFGFTCEDADRKLESGGVKVPHETAIPRGRYRVQLSFSNRFQRVMPEVLAVPQFTGIRIHGGNTSEQTSGCPLLGKVRTPDGVANCAERNAALIALIEKAEDMGDEVWLEVV